MLLLTGLINRPKVQRFDPYLMNYQWYSTKGQCISQESSQKTKLSQKKVKALAGMNVPKPPPETVTDVFPDEVLPTPAPETVAVVFQEKEQPE